MWKYLTNLVLNKRTSILIAGVILSLACLALLPRLKVETGRSKMARGLPAEEKYQELAKKFNLTNTIIIIARADNIQASASALIENCQIIAKLLKNEGTLDCLIDHPFFQQKALYYLSDQEFQSLSEKLENSAESLASYIAQPQFASLLSILNSFWQNNSGTTTTSEKKLKELDLLITSLLEASFNNYTPFENFIKENLSIKENQRVRSATDHSFSYAYFYPLSPRTDTAYILPLVNKLKTILEEQNSSAIEFLLAGEPALIAEEMRAIDKDNTILSIFGFLSVALIFFLAFGRNYLLGLSIIAALALAILWSFGALTLTIGSLNLISSVFVIILIGLGIDYGIHWLGSFQEYSKQHSLPEATLFSYQKSGRGIITGGLTTMAAFAAIGLNPYKGFAELGIIASLGVGCCLLSMLVVFPAVISKWPAKAREKELLPNRLGNRLLKATINFSLNKALSLTVLAVLLVISSFLLFKSLYFEHNILKLLPKNSSSAIAAELFEKKTEFSLNGALLSASNFSELKRLDKKLKGNKLIKSTNSILDLLPNTAGREKKIKKLKSLILPAGEGGKNPIAECKKLQNNSQKISEALFSSGQAALIPRAENIFRQTTKLCQKLASLTDKEIDYLDLKTATILLPLALRLRLALNASPPQISNIPQLYKRNLISQEGHFLLTANPSKSIWQPTNLKEFNDFVTASSSSATGFPLQFAALTANIFKGFIIASILSALAIFFFILLDFKNMRWTIATTFTLLLGIILTAALLKLFAIPLSLVNIVALPLIIGIGIDSSVHFAHSLRRNGEQLSSSLLAVLRSIFLSSLTTAACFGFLSLAKHRGLASLGQLLLLGIFSTFCCSLIFLPAIAKTFGLLKND